MWPLQAWVTHLHAPYIDDFTGFDEPWRHTNVVHAATFSPNGRTLVTVGFDNQVLLWDVTDPSRPSPIWASLTAHTDRVNTAVFSPTVAHWPPVASTTRYCCGTSPTRGNRR